jgi:hypothetical protein
MAAEACLHASVVSASVLPPIVGPMAVHVSLFIRSVAMFSQAVFTSFSICPARVTTSAPACTKA